LIFILLFQASISFKQSKLLELDKKPIFYHKIKSKTETPEKTRIAIDLINYSKYPIYVEMRGMNCNKEAEKIVTIEPNKTVTPSFPYIPSKIEMKSHNLFDPKLTIEMIFYPSDG